MKPLPLPVRIAAGLAVTAVERARKLPQQLAGLPVTVVSEALQLSMRVQQQVTELAIKGDDVLAGLHPAQESPEWATFDEDVPQEETERATAEEPPSRMPGYDELSLPQLRAKLRMLSVDELEELLAYEFSHAGRPQFTGMLTRRIATVRAQS